MVLAIVFKTATIMNQEYAQGLLVSAEAFEVPRNAFNCFNDDNLYCIQNDDIFIAYRSLKTRTALNHGGLSFYFGFVYLN